MCGLVKHGAGTYMHAFNVVACASADVMMGHGYCLVRGAVSGCARCAGSQCWVCAYVRTAMASLLHGVCVGAC